MTSGRGLPFKNRVRNGVLERFSRCCKRWLWIKEFRIGSATHGRLYQCKTCYNLNRKPEHLVLTKEQAERRNARIRANYAQLRAAGVPPREADRLKCKSLSRRMVARAKYLTGAA